MSGALVVTTNVELHANKIVLSEVDSVTDAEIAAHRILRTWFVTFRRHIFLKTRNDLHHHYARKLIELLEIRIVSPGELRILRVDLIHQLLVVFLDGSCDHVNIAA